jgi:anti-sigma regulatory factor (Ser/Thr protein kinase)
MTRESTVPPLPVVPRATTVPARPVQRHDVPLVSCTRPAEAARDAVRGALRELSPEQLDDIVLGINELVANAVEHTPGPLRLILELQSHRLVAEVCDPMPDTRAVQERPAGAQSQGGRGLRIVSELAEQWFVRGTEDGKAVCAAFVLPSPVEGLDDGP